MTDSPEAGGRGRGDAGVRLYRSSDWPDVVSLLTACYGESATHASLYERWNLKCPAAGSAFSVVEVDGRVVGAQPMLLHEWRDGATSVRGGVLTGVVVHPSHRRQGLFSALVQGCLREAWTQGATFVLTMPNERSRPGFLRMGWTELGDRSVLARPLRPLPKGGGAIRSADDVSREVAELQARHQMAFPGVAVSRTPEWWRWRFAGSAGRSYIQVLARDPQGSLEAIAVGTIRASRGIAIGYLVDFLAASPKALATVCSGLSAELARAGALGAVSVVSSPEVQRALRECGFVRVPRLMPIKRFRTVVRFRPCAADAEARLGRLAAWNLTLGDWDNI